MKIEKSQKIVLDPPDVIKESTIDAWVKSQPKVCIYVCALAVRDAR